ncbi:MAG TPA: hypothetical protein VIJ25_02885 [Methylococcales bacterium]
MGKSLVMAIPLGRQTTPTKRLVIGCRKATANHCSLFMKRSKGPIAFFGNECIWLSILKLPF